TRAAGGWRQRHAAYGPGPLPLRGEEGGAKKTPLISTASRRGSSRKRRPVRLAGVLFSAFSNTFRRAVSRKRPGYAADCSLRAAKPGRLRDTARRPDKIGRSLSPTAIPDGRGSGPEIGRA